MNEPKYVSGGKDFSDLKTAYGFAVNHETYDVLMTLDGVNYEVIYRYNTMSERMERVQMVREAREKLLAKINPLTSL